MGEALVQDQPQGGDIGEEDPLVQYDYMEDDVDQVAE